jgi:hypothetical protein
MQQFKLQIGFHNLAKPIYQFLKNLLETRRTLNTGGVGSNAGRNGNIRRMPRSLGS